MTSSISSPSSPAHRAARSLVLASVLGALAWASPAEAQSQRGGPQGDPVERQVTALREALGLTDAQAAELRTMFDAQAAARPEQRPDPRTVDRTTLRAQRAERQAERDRQIEAVLTPDQVQRYRTWRDAQRADGRRGRRGDGA